MDYRADIDGVRAIAVLSVVIFHYGVAQVSGGFVGVDVFFVISGYLITRNLYNEISKQGLSLVDFYNRRIRRIVPALLFVLVATMAASYFVLMPGDYAALGESAAYSAAGAGNIYFFLNTGYFDREAGLQPLLHMWSLGVEEQFYLAWPILLALFMKSSKLARFLPALLVLLVIATTFAASVWVMQADQKSAFYLPHLRAWELAIGAMLVFAPQIKSRVVSELVGPIGLALIGYSLFFLTEKHAFPGINAVAAVLGSALLLLPRTTSITAIALAVPPIRFVGLISYSLYLWHWPALVLFRHYANGDMPNLAEAGVLAAISVALATLSWWFIERPVRRSKVKPVAMIVSGLSAVAVVIAAGVALMFTGGVEARIADKARTMSTLDVMWEWECKNVFVTELNNTYCSFGADWQTASSRALVWGDSHAEHIAPIIEAADRDPNMSFLLVVPCPAGLGGSVHRIRTEEPGYDERCTALRERGLALLEALPNIRLMVFSAAWGGLPYVISQDGSLPPNLTGSQLLKAGLQEFIDKARTPGRKFLLIGQVPSYPGDPVPCLISSSASILRRNCEDIGPAMWRMRDTLQEPVNMIFREIAERYSDVTLILPSDKLCAHGTCLTVLDGEPLYREGDHIRRNLSLDVRRAYAERIGITKASLGGDGPAEITVSIGDTPPATAPVVVDAGPAGTDAMTWWMDKQGADGVPRLRYYDPLTGATMLRLECLIGGTIYIHVPVPVSASAPPKDWPFMLLAGDLPSPNGGYIGPIKDGVIDVIGAFPQTDGVLTAFRTSGVVSLSDVRYPDPVPLNAVTAIERAIVREYFKVCAGPAN